MRYKIAGEIWGYNTNFDAIKKDFLEYEYREYADEVINLCLDGLIEFRKQNSMSCIQSERIFILQKFAENLLCSKKLLLHAAVISINTKCFVIIGGSGAGKSTFIDMIHDNYSQKNVKIIADDRVVIAEIDGQLDVWNTPWSKRGVCCKESKYPIEGIIFLEKSKTCKIYEINEEQSINILASMYPQYVWEKVSGLAKQLLKISAKYKFENNLIDFDIAKFEKVLKV